MGTVIMSAALILGGTFAMYPAGVLSLLQIATIVICGLALYSLIMLPLFVPVMVKSFGAAKLVAVCLADKPQRVTEMNFHTLASTNSTFSYRESGLSAAYGTGTPVAGSGTSDTAPAAVRTPRPATASKHGRVRARHPAALRVFAVNIAIA